MEIKNKETILNDLIINKIPSKSIYEQMVQEGKVNDNELYLIGDIEDLPYKYTFTAKEGDTSFTFPFDVKNMDDLNVFFNGLLMTKDINYSVSENTITLLDFVAEAGDNIVILNIRGIEPDEYASSIMDNLQTSMRILDAKVAELPENMNELMRTTQSNIMTSGSKITMAADYAPSATTDVSTKGYVDQQISVNRITKTSQLTNDSGFLTEHLVKSVNGMVGDVSIKGAYIGSYVGDGKSLSKTFTFDFNPAFFLLISVSTSNRQPISASLIINGMTYPIWFYNGGYGTSITATWSNNSITLTATLSNYLTVIQGNTYTYYYLAIPKF